MQYKVRRTLAKIKLESRIPIQPFLRVHDGVAYIVGGHHKFNALLRLGYDRIPIKYLHSSDLGKTLSDGTFIRTIEDIIAGSHLCE